MEFTLAAMPVIIWGWTQAFKKAGLNPNYCPLFALLSGMGFSFIFTFGTASITSLTQLAIPFLMGLYWGLGAIGVHEVGDKIMET